MNRFLCLALLVPLLFTACEDFPRYAPRGGTHHLPLLQDRMLRYRVSESGKVYEYTMALRYLGGKSYKVYAAQLEGPNPGGIEFSSHDDQVTAITQLSYTSLFSRNEVADFSELWIDENAEVGDVWQNEDTGTQTVLAGFETVTVPAGTFTDCYKTVTEALPILQDSINARFDRGELSGKAYQAELEFAKYVVVRWFAPNVGLVKVQVDPSIRTIELLAVLNEGVVNDSISTAGK